MIWLFNLIGFIFLLLRGFNKHDKISVYLNGSIILPIKLHITPYLERNSYQCLVEKSDMISIVLFRFGLIYIPTYSDL